MAQPVVDGSATDSPFLDEVDSCDHLSEYDSLVFYDSSAFYRWGCCKYHSVTVICYQLLPLSILHRDIVKSCIPEAKT